MLQKLSEKFDSDKSLSTLEYFKRKKIYIFIPLPIVTGQSLNMRICIWSKYTTLFHEKKKIIPGAPHPSPLPLARQKDYIQSNCNNWLKGVVFKGSYFSEDSCTYLQQIIVQNHIFMLTNLLRLSYL
jgi:hypothetical protein